MRASLLISLYALINSCKKGVGLPKNLKWKDSTSKRSDAKLVESLGIGWYYNWGPKAHFESLKVNFVPMVWGSNTPITSLNGSMYILGFNEPDHLCQAKMTVDTVLVPYNSQSQSIKDSQLKMNTVAVKKCGKSAIVTFKNPNVSLWDSIYSLSNNVGAPGTAGDSTKGWFKEFSNKTDKYHFIQVHWYGGKNPGDFIRYIKKVYNMYKKPIWVTEFAPQTRQQSIDSPWKYTRIEINNFIKETVNWMESKSYIHRYAWHHSYVGRCALFNTDGTLTKTGRYYRDV
jgi:hypothetical protein